MLTSEAHGFLFIHVQKTGGTSIETLLSAAPDVHKPQGCPKHGGLRIALRRDPGLADRWVFGFVRNPWARYVSWWEMIQRVKAEGTRTRRSRKMLARVEFIRRSVEYPDFDAFVEHGPAEFPRLSRSQISYLSTPKRRADFIGRTESFADDIRTVLARLELPVPGELPQRNKSSYGSYRDYYSPATRDRVGELFEDDIDEFGYDF